MRPIAMISPRLRSFRTSLRDWTADCRGVAAVEFAFIVPLMLVMFFGTVEICSGIAVDRKVTLMARTLSDLTSQSTSVADADMANFFLVANDIIWPYQAAAPSPNFAAPESATITELYVDPTTHKARVQWSKGTAPRTPKHGCHHRSLRAPGRLHLSDPQRSQLPVCTYGQPFHAEDRCDFERRCLHPPATVEVRVLQRHRRHDELSDKVAVSRPGRDPVQAGTTKRPRPDAAFSAF